MNRQISCTISEMKTLADGHHKRFLLTIPSKDKYEQSLLYEMLSTARKKGLKISCHSPESFCDFKHLLTQCDVYDKTQ